MLPPPLSISISLALLPSCHAAAASSSSTVASSLPSQAALSVSEDWALGSGDSWPASVDGLVGSGDGDNISSCLGGDTSCQDGMLGDETAGFWGKDRLQ